MRELTLEELRARTSTSAILFQDREFLSIEVLLSSYVNSVTVGKRNPLNGYPGLLLAKGR